MFVSAQVTHNNATREGGGRACPPQPWAPDHISSGKAKKRLIGHIIRGVPLPV